jgi:hypothetical protein
MRNFWYGGVSSSCCNESRLAWRVLGGVTATTLQQPGGIAARAGTWTNGADEALISPSRVEAIRRSHGGLTEMTRIQGTIARDATDAFWAALKRALELEDLAKFKEAVRQIRRVSPAAAIAIADVIEADDEPDEAPAIVRWLVAALRGEVIPMLH